MKKKGITVLALSALLMVPAGCTNTNPKSETEGSIVVTTEAEPITRVASTEITTTEVKEATAEVTTEVTTETPQTEEPTTIATTEAKPEDLNEDRYIDEAHFPEEGFWTYVMGNMDPNFDGVLTPEERSIVKEISVTYSYEIESLRGIEYFPELEELNCWGCRLTELDVSKNKKLRELLCCENQLTTLNVAGLASLEELSCWGNALSELDVSGCDQLNVLWCYKNKLTTLNVSGNPRLGSFYCGDNQLTSLDLREAKELYALGCENNQISELNLSQNSQLSSIDCANNKLTRLDISRNPELSTLYISGNPLTVLNIRNNTKLTCLDIDASVKVLDTEANGDPTIATYSHMEVGYEEDIPLDPSIFPDDAFRAYLRAEFDWNDDGVLDLYELEYTSSIDARDKGIKSLKGIEVFVTLRSLWCDGCGLTELDVSHNLMLVDLSCGDNKLTSLDVSKNTRLNDLYCVRNRITELDLSNNRWLEQVNCDSIVYIEGLRNGVRLYVED